jgi:Fic family protein
MRRPSCYSHTPTPFRHPLLVGVSAYRSSRHLGGLLPKPLLYLSAYIEAHRRDHYDLLQRVSTHGDWIGWLRFFIAGVTKIALEAVGQAGHLMDLREKFRTLLRDKPKALALLDELFLNPYMSVPELNES